MALDFTYADETNEREKRQQTNRTMLITHCIGSLRVLFYSFFFFRFKIKIEWLAYRPSRIIKNKHNELWRTRFAAVRGENNKQVQLQKE